LERQLHSIWDTLMDFLTLNLGKVWNQQTQYEAIQKFARNSTVRISKMSLRNWIDILTLTSRQIMDQYSSITLVPKMLAIWGAPLPKTSETSLWLPLQKEAEIFNTAPIVKLGSKSSLHLKALHLQSEILRKSAKTLAWLKYQHSMQKTHRLLMIFRLTGV